MSSVLGGFNAREHYADGMNLYLYAGSDPVNQTDPAGLFAIGGLADLMGSSAISNALRGLEGADVTSRAIDFAGGLLAGVGMRNAIIDLVIDSMVDRVGGKALDAALGLAGAGFRKLRSAYNKGGVNGIGDEAMGTGFTAGNGASMGGAPGTPEIGCFPAGTPVMLADGTTVPIECLGSDSVMLCRSESGDGGEAAFREKEEAPPHIREKARLRPVRTNASLLAARRGAGCLNGYS